VNGALRPPRARDNPERVKTAPDGLPVGRVDDVKAVRTLDLAYGDAPASG